MVDLMTNNVELVKEIEKIDYGMFYLDFFHDKPCPTGEYITKHCHDMSDKKDKKALIDTILITPSQLILKFDIKARWINIKFEF